MTATHSAFSLVLGSSLLVGTALTGACVDRVDTAIKSCPCAAGNVCCESGVCASEQASCGVATAALSQSVKGHWKGYIENFRTDVGVDDDIEVEIAVEEDGTMSGQVVFGIGDPPALPTDSEVPWPPGWSQVQTTFIEGAPYAARDIAWQARRLKLRVAMYAPWQTWCSLQQSYPDAGSSTGYYCVPSLIEMDGTGRCWVPATPTTPRGPDFDCQKSSLCYEMCSCDGTTCKAVDDAFYPLDVAFDGEQASGSIKIHEIYNLRLTRTNSSP